jgi:thiol-disulfide isomerase/thioredoxin
MRYFLILLIVLIQMPSRAQQPYAVHTMAGELNFPVVLSAAPAPSSLAEARDRLVIIDFFGTWCGPCVRALPNLQQLQKKFENEIRIILVAEENMQTLKKFIAKYESFNLPMVIDTGSLIRSAIQPPYYPYSLVIAKNGEILAHPSQGQITEESIRGWINSQDSNKLAINTAPPANRNVPELNPGKTETKMSSPAIASANRLIQLSQDFLFAAKTGENTSAYTTELKAITLSELEAAVYTDDEKKAFWINLYNAWTQVLLKENPDRYQKRGAFFGNRIIQIANQHFSLDDIEHGILRRSKIKWSLGYLNKFFPRKIEKALRVNKLDFRLHFALNCGAKSCPPIAFYKPGEIDRQLDQAAKAYLTSEAVYDTAANRLMLPAIMGWFRHDFNGKKGMIALLKKHSILPADKSPRIRFKKYDWSLFLQNYKQ